MTAPAIPREVIDLLGPNPFRLLGYGASATFAGRGRVAKVGPVRVVGREARILGEPIRPFPLALPPLVAAGAGWLVMEEVADVAEPWSEPEFARLLGDLARLHDAFEGSSALGEGWLRDPAGADLDATLAEGAEDRSSLGLPADVARVLDDPAPVARILAQARPLTLVHGDPTPANVRRPTTGERLWIDWEWASAASAAVDLACWLAEGPWHFGHRLDRELCLATYLGARRRPVDRAALELELDAALVLFLFANNLPSLARAKGPGARDALIAEAAEALERLALG